MSRSLSSKWVVEWLLHKYFQNGNIPCSVIPSSKLGKKKKKTILSSLPGPPTHHIYTLVLGLTQFLQKFFFHLSKLNTHRHFSYELLTAFLGNLLAVP